MELATHSRAASEGGLKIAVPRLSRIANFDDLDPLVAEPGVQVEIIAPGRALPGDADLVLIPGTKSTTADLAYFRAQGWDTDLAAHLRRGGHVLGICGGYQMLGRQIEDADGVEGVPGSHAGLGVLNVTTRMRPKKHLSRISGQAPALGCGFDGYEIHIGETGGPDCARGWLTINDRHAGAASPDGRARGCYVHGLFENDSFRRAYLQALGAHSSTFCHGADIEATLDALAAHMEQNLDIEGFLKLARRV